MIMTILAQISTDQINAVRDVLSLDIQRLFVFIIILFIALLLVIAYFVLRPNKNTNESIKAANDAAVSANKAAESANATTQSALLTLNQHQEVLKGLTDAVSEFRQGAAADRGAITGNTEAVSMLHNAVEQIAKASKDVAIAVEKSVENDDRRQSAITGGLSKVQLDIENLKDAVVRPLQKIMNDMEARWQQIGNPELLQLTKSVQHIEQMVSLMYSANVAHANSDTAPHGWVTPTDAVYDAKNVNPPSTTTDKPIDPQPVEGVKTS